MVARRGRADSPRGGSLGGDGAAAPRRLPPRGKFGLRAGKISCLTTPLRRGSPRRLPQGGVWGVVARRGRVDSPEGELLYVAWVEMSRVRKR